MENPLKYYNVHKTGANNLEQLLNDHVEKGYRVHWMRNCFFKGETGGGVQVIFEKTFETKEERDLHRQEREARRKQAACSTSAPPLASDASLLV